ncbi:MAG: hypothetical protein WDO19_30965 [Bacteroidota bacterium]
MNYQFEHTFFFWLMAAIPFFIFLFYLLLRWKKKTIKRIGDAWLVKELIKGFSPNYSPQNLRCSPLHLPQGLSQ